MSAGVPHVSMCLAVGLQPSAKPPEVARRVVAMSEECARLRDEVARLRRLTRPAEPTLERNLRPARDQPKVTADPSPQLELGEVA